MVSPDQTATPTPPPPPIDLPLRKRLARATAIPLALTTLLSGGLAWQVNRTDKAGGQDLRADLITELTHRVEARFAELEGSLRDPAPGSPGTAATMDRVTRARAALDAPLAELRARIHADGAAVPHGERLATAITSWLESARQAADARIRAQADAAASDRAASQARVAAAAAVAAMQAKAQALARARAGHGSRAARARSAAPPATAAVPGGTAGGVGTTTPIDGAAANAASAAANSAAAAGEALAESRRRAEGVRDELRAILAAENNARAQASVRRGRLQGWTYALIFLLPALVGMALAGFLRGQIRALAMSLTAEARRARASRDGAQSQLREASRALEAALQNEELYRGVVHAARDYALFFLGRDGAIGSWNPGVESLFGWTPAEWTGKPLAQLFRAQDSSGPRDVSRILATAAGRGSFAEETWLARKDGTAFWAEVSLAPVHSDAGSVRKLRGFAVLVRDATRKRRTETELSLLFARVEEEARARDRFLAIAAHELRAPAATLQAELAELARTEAAGERGTRVERAAKLATRLARLVDEMAQLSRAHAGRLGYEYRETDLSALVADTLRDLGDQFAAAGCALELRVDPGVRGNFDAGRLRQALYHLISNALRRGQGRPIQIALSSVGERVRLAIHDAGPGVEKARQREIFERFSGQAPVAPAASNAPGTSDEAGFGVGLYLARQIAEGHGGRVWLESEPGTGATFFLELPLHPVSAGGAGLTTAPVMGSPGLERHGP